MTNNPGYEMPRETEADALDAMADGLIAKARRELAADRYPVMLFERARELKDEAVRLRYGAHAP